MSWHEKIIEESLESDFLGYLWPDCLSVCGPTFRFSYADGVIEEIYADPTDSASALNIKRGLLSAFQNTMPRLDLEHKDEEVSFVP